MEAATIPTETAEAEAPASEVEVETTVEHSPAEEQEPETLMRYAQYVHIGDGADECEHREDGACEEPAHFHAWCRLPNPFQHSSIREKALAAKARRSRQLHDDETDAYEILEAEMDALSRAGEKQGIIDELLGKDYWRAQTAALGDLTEKDEYTHIQDDLVKFATLQEVPEGERNKDEYVELEHHVREFQEALDAARTEELRPRREALEALDILELVAQLRDLRVATEGDNAFSEAYAMWQMYIGTLKPRDPAKGRPIERVWGDVNHCRDDASPEEVTTLQAVYLALETGLKGSTGNS